MAAKAQLRRASAQVRQGHATRSDRAARHRLCDPSPGKHVKYFTAYDPVARWTVAKAFQRAAATAAAMFLDKLVSEMPFKVDAIQVDGRPEFMAEFETACQDRAIMLYLLPPKSPQINGAVERYNSSWRYEFYAVYDLPTRVEDLNPLIDAFQHCYNTYRPHDALGGKTPRTVPCSPPRQRDRRISYVLSADTDLTAI